MIACNGVVAILSILIRIYLSYLNKRRANRTDDAPYDDAIVIVQNEKGEDTKQKVDRAFLDLTDRQNLEYRYVL